MLVSKLLYRFTVFSLFISAMAANASAGVITNVVAISGNGDRTTATSAIGFISGNDVFGPISGGPLLGYLNSGTGDSELVLLGSPNVNFKISAEGMFAEPQGNPADFINKTDGDYITRSDDWSFVGKVGFDEPLEGTFVSMITQPIGDTPGLITLRLASDGGVAPLGGTVAISLKAGNNYSVYAFQNLTNTFAFEFSGLPSELGNVSLYVIEGSDVGPVVPEPSSLAIFGLGGLGLGVMGWRRRKGNRDLA
jgi:hypothetical protein